MTPNKTSRPSTRRAQPTLAVPQGWIAESSGDAIDEVAALDKPMRRALLDSLTRTAHKFESLTREEFLRTQTHPAYKVFVEEGAPILFYIAQLQDNTPIAVYFALEKDKLLLLHVTKYDSGRTNKLEAAITTAANRYQSATQRTSEKTIPEQPAQAARPNKFLAEQIADLIDLKQQIATVLENPSSGSSRSTNALVRQARQLSRQIGLAVLQGQNPIPVASKALVTPGHTQAIREDALIAAADIVAFHTLHGLPLDGSVPAYGTRSQYPEGSARNSYDARVGAVLDVQRGFVGSPAVRTGLDPTIPLDLDRHQLASQIDRSLATLVTAFPGSSGMQQLL